MNVHPSQKRKLEINSETLKKLDEFQSELAQGGIEAAKSADGTCPLTKPIKW